MSRDVKRGRKFWKKRAAFWRAGLRDAKAKLVGMEVGYEQRVSGLESKLMQERDAHDRDGAALVHAKRELESLRREVSEGREAQRRCQREHNNGLASEKIRALEIVSAGANKAAEALRAENERLQRELEDALRERAQRGELLSRAEGELAASKRDLATTKGELVEFEARLARVGEKVNVALSERDEARSERATAFEARASASKKRDEALSQRDAALARTTVLETKVNELANDLDRMVNERNVANYRITELKKDVEARAKERDEAHGRLRALEGVQAERDLARAAQDELEKRLATVRHELAKARSEIAEWQAHHEPPAGHARTGTCVRCGNGAGQPSMCAACHDEVLRTMPEHSRCPFPGCPRPPFAVPVEVGPGGILSPLQRAQVLPGDETIRPGTSAAKILSPPVGEILRGDVPTRDPAASFVPGAPVVLDPSRPFSIVLDPARTLKGIRDEPIEAVTQVPPLPPAPPLPDPEFAGRPLLPPTIPGDGGQTPRVEIGGSS